jgi:uncharacterized membrane protein YfcA
MELPYIIILVVTGGVTGFAGGLLGVGGAFMMTPVQFIVYTNIGLSEDLAILTAFGTSLMVILPTSISGTFRHHSKDVVNWKAAAVMGVTSMLFALGGATLANHLPADVLKIAFGVILVLTVARLMFSGTPREKDGPVNNPWVWVLWAMPVGVASGLFGIGGGILLVPVLVIVMRFSMHNAIGTSLAAIIFTSVGGVVGYIVNGIGVPGRLPFSLGYINLTAWIMLVIPSALMVQVGAATAHRIPHRPLTIIFMVVLFYFGLRMIGVFQWLGLPL